MKAKKLKQKILGRKIDCFPVKYTINYVLVQSAYGSRKLIKVKHSFFNSRIREGVRDAKKKSKQ